MNVLSSCRSSVRLCAVSVLVIWFVWQISMPVGAQVSPAQTKPGAANTKAPLKRETPKPEGADTPSLSSQQLLYQYLISEIAGQRGRAQLAARSMLDLAQKSRDPRLARRAAEIAFQGRQTTEAREALLLWLALEPESSVARQALGALLGTQGPIDKVAETMTLWLADRAAAPRLFEQMPLLLARYPDRARVATLVAELALPFEKLPEAQYAVGMTAFAAGRVDAAAIAIDLALSGRPNFPRAAIAKAQLLRAVAADGANASANANANDAALRFLADYLTRFDRDTEVRVAYARLLVSDKALLSAREEFRRASAELPRDGELVYAVALISLQIEDWDAAAAGFKRSLNLDPRDRNPILFNLALASEGKKDIDESVVWFRQVTEGDYFVSAQLKIANHLAKREGIDAGRRHLQDAQKAEVDSPDVRVQLVLAEAQLLRDAGSLEDARQVLTVALAKQPESIPLRYDRAMISEKLNLVDDMERDLRTVINIKPDHAHAYNALGYSFAERGIRLDESYELIRKAVELAPDDAFILDSLGWVQFKLKRTDDALATLTRAYRMRADPEIAAHLGEVLLAVGKIEAAQQIWKRALLDNPDNATLTALIERHKK